MRSARGAKPNVTGFDMRKMRAAAGQPKYDPWERTSVNPILPSLAEAPSARAEASILAKLGRELTR